MEDGQTMQYVFVEDELIKGITSPEYGIAVYTDINLSFALTEDGIPLYKWTGSEVIPRTEEEIEADREAARKAAAAAERERVANATETVLLEMAADHEERLCMIEMGVSINDL